MKSISNFKRVAAIIIGSITLLFLFNLYYLAGFYRSIKVETDRTILSCIQKADIDELYSRLMIEKREEKRKKGIENSVSYIQELHDPDSVSRGTMYSRVGNGKQMLIRRRDLNQKNGSYFTQMFEELRLGLHAGLDSIYPINILRYDSIVNAELEKKGIYVRTICSQIIDVKSGRFISTSLSPESIRKAKDKVFFIYVFNKDRGRAYRVYISSLTAVVFEQMWGILLSTFLIIVLLGFSFYYFIKTVMQQKTVEEMKDDFTNNMTHELKTPIAVAYSATDALLNFKQGDIKEKRDVYLRICLDQLSQLGSLVEQILSMSMEKRKNFILKKEKVPMKPLLEKLTGLYQLKSERKIHFDIQVTPTDLKVNVDFVHWENIISNLIDNAIKYSIDEPPYILIRCICQGSEAIFTIQDHGIGISPENRQHIFEKFYRVPHGNVQNVKGYGLGLFYVKTMVEKHNGSISVKSVLHEGTEFIITLPQ